MTESRRYVQRARASAQVDTRARILAATRDLIPTAGTSLPVTAIARHAGVAVQTIYDQFGSKGGLLIALIGDVQASGGLFESFPWVFSSRHGEEAMRRMIRATMGLWSSAWPFVEFILRAQRTDPVVSREMAFIDRLRHAHYWAITSRLDEEGRLPEGLDAVGAADRAFALTIPTVYEELGVRRGASVDAAIETVTTAVIAVITRSGSVAKVDPPPDWPRLEAAAFARARATGSDPDRLSSEWSGAFQRVPRRDEA